VHALTAYKRGGDKANGRNNPIMAGMAQPLSDRDMADIAAYLQACPRRSSRSADPRGPLQ
jgi:cytochrome c553